MSQPDQQLSVPTDAVLAATTAQRNAAYDRLAQMEALVQQLVADRNQLADELEKLRTDAAADQR